MYSIQPSVVIEHVTSDAVQLIERAGRTCYKSGDRISAYSATQFVRMLIRRGHESVLEHATMTVRCITDRGISHELVRHRLASFCQESTRYCNYGKGGQVAFVCPHWLATGTETEIALWNKACQESEQHYLELLRLGRPPEDARGALNVWTKTEVVITANLREWRLILKQRTAEAAHPDMRRLMRPLLGSLSNATLAPVFDDIVGGLEGTSILRPL